MSHPSSRTLILKRKSNTKKWDLMATKILLPKKTTKKSQAGEKIWPTMRTASPSSKMTALSSCMASTLNSARGPWVCWTIKTRSESPLFG